MLIDDFSVLEKNFAAWERKPQLRLSYRRYFDLILGHCEPEHTILELGAGFGAFSDYARSLGFSRWVSSDVLPTRFSKLVANAGKLPFKNGVLDCIVFVDVLHHLEHPMRMFSEAARVLVPGGKIVCVEPWISPFSWLIYRYLHHEGADLNRDPERPFQDDTKQAYHGCSALATVVVRKTSTQRWEDIGFKVPSVTLINDFSYLLTGGFSSLNVFPSKLIQFVRAEIDNRFRFISPYVCMRALIVWERIQYIQDINVMQ